MKNWNTIIKKQIITDKNGIPLDICPNLSETKNNQVPNIMKKYTNIFTTKVKYLTSAKIPPAKIKTVHSATGGSARGVRSRESQIKISRTNNFKQRIRQINWDKHTVTIPRFYGIFIHSAHFKQPWWHTYNGNRFQKGQPTN